MGKCHFEWNHEGAEALLRSAGVQDDLMARGKRIKES